MYYKNGGRTHSLDAVGVVHGEFGVVTGLDSFVDDSVYNAEGVEFKLDAFVSAVGDLLVLFVEVVEELRLLDREERR
jgi:hypothetical protein